jgi:menaquinone-dependent protoporphyrinogen oxidase
MAVWVTRAPEIDPIETSCGGENEMDKVLVAYASKYGATAEIAEKIGQVLCEAGLDTDVLPADRVGDLTPYKAVVLGSAVYIGMWQKKAATFLKANEKALAERPVWLFSSGPAGEGDPVELTQGWRFPKSLQPVADRIGPRDIAVFHGNVDIEKVNFIEKAAIRNVKAPFGDFRDWEAIAAWATGIADVLKEAGLASPSRVG